MTIADSTARGRPATLPANATSMTTTPAATSPVSCVLAPAFSTAAVLDRLPATPIPPNRPDAAFATPDATSSPSVRTRSPVAGVGLAEGLSAARLFAGKTDDEDDEPGHEPGDDRRREELGEPAHAGEPGQYEHHPCGDGERRGELVVGPVSTVSVLSGSLVAVMAGGDVQRAGGSV